MLLDYLMVSAISGMVMKVMWCNIENINSNLTYLVLSLFININEALHLHNKEIKNIINYKILNYDFDIFKFFSNFVFEIGMPREIVTGHLPAR